jgi:hypothetical protein
MMNTQFGIQRPVIARKVPPKQIANETFNRRERDAAIRNARSHRLYRSQTSFQCPHSGIESRDVALTGIRADEFSVLTVETSDKDRSVTRFEIILARGQSPVDRASVKGNSFDLNKFKGSAKPGDRAVVEVKTVSGSDKELTGDERIIKIPIK